MPNSAEFANRAGGHAQAQGHMMQRNARFIDPWKKAAGQIAQARLDGSQFGRPGAHRAPMGRTQNRLLRGIVWGATKGANQREAIRFHTPNEFTPQGIDEQQAAQRNQTQPGERPPEESSFGGLSNEQFGGQASRNPWGEDSPPVAL